MLKFNTLFKRVTAAAAILLLTSAGAFAQYCTPLYTTGTAASDYINGVTLEGISNLGTGGSITTTGYSDYTALSADLTNGASYSLTVDNGTSYSITITAWIDYDQDETFETDEVLGNLSLSASGSGIIDFTVPITALGGGTRMRVRGIYPSGLAVPLDPCNSVTYGEAEDYTINLSGGLENNIAVTAISSPVSGADIGYEDVTITLWNTGTADASGFTVNYNVDGGFVTGDFYPGTLAAGATAEYTFGEGWTFSDYGCFEVSAWVDYDADEFAGDDMFTKTVCNLGPVTGTGAYYVNSSAVGYEPWGSASNTDAMNTVFGGDWSQAYFESVDPGTLFSSENCFVFLEGSDAHANELETFLSTNIGTIESWVAAGGHLLLNAAPNEGDGMSFGFDGTSLVYAYYTGTAGAVDAGHPIFVGPYTPVGTEWTGSSFGHARITGDGLTNLIWDVFATSNIVLAEKTYGDGRVVFGGMTTNNFHSPATEAANLRANIIAYLACEPLEVCSAPSAPEVSVLSSTAAEVSWAAVDGATQYVFVLRDNTTGEHWTRNTTDTYMYLGALTAGHSYTTRIRTNCYPDGMSTPSGQTDFTTPLRLGAVDGGLSIYPNPNDGNFRLQLNGYASSDMQVQIMNTVGQVVYNSNFYVNDDITVQDINLSTVESGTYIVRISNGAETFIQTLIIE